MPQMQQLTKCSMQKCIVSYTVGIHWYAVHMYGIFTLITHHGEFIQAGEFKKSHRSCALPTEDLTRLIHNTL